jgi:hypothetical protein
MELDDRRLRATDAGYVTGRSAKAASPSDPRARLLSHTVAAALVICSDHKRAGREQSPERRSSTRRRAVLDPPAAPARPVATPPRFQAPQ